MDFILYLNPSTSYSALRPDSNHLPKSLLYLSPTFAPLRNLLIAVLVTKGNTTTVLLKKKKQKTKKNPVWTTCPPTRFNWLCLSSKRKERYTIMVRSALINGMCAKSLQPCPTLYDPIAHHAPLSIGFSRQEYSVATPSSRGSSWPRDQTHVSYVSCIGRQVLYH